METGGFSVCDGSCVGFSAVLISMGSLFYHFGPKIANSRVSVEVLLGFSNDCIIDICFFCVIIFVIKSKTPHVRMRKNLSCQVHHSGTCWSGPASGAQAAGAVEDITWCDVNTQMVVKSPHVDIQMAP